MNFCGQLGISIFIAVIAMGCSKKKSTDSVDNRNSPTFQGPPEEAYCATVSVFLNPVTITGTASYQYRQPFGSGAGGGLSSVQATPKPIRRAEVRVKNSGGSIVQCGETDNSGDFTVDLPKDTGTYTIEVNSRAFNNYARVTVFNRPVTNQFYSMTTTVSSSASTNVGSMVASATGTVLAGAFNILDQTVLANEYLKANVGTGTCGGSGCTETDVAPKLSIYWEMGFNPSTYIPGNPPLSYYIPNHSRLFILGGLNGDVDNSDTDHFDNSIILHEYGHFIEDVLTETDSPGGNHNGDSIIDPRLAWSEGWGNFFQAAVTGDGRYIDTSGNSDGTTGFLFYVDLEDNTSPTYDNPQSGPNNSKSHTTKGEGNFREFSIARLMYDSVDTNIDSESITGGFSELWTVLTNPTWGWKNSKWKFRSVGLAHHLQTSLGGGTDWSGLHTLENQAPNRLEYAQYITPDNGCSDAAYFVTLTPSNAPPGGAAPSTDYYRDHDFYHIVFSGTTAGSLTVEFQDADSSGTKADLDLFLYDSGAKIFDTSDRKAFTTSQNASTDPTVSEVDTATLSNLPAGDYLLQVFSWYGTGSAVRYALKLNGVKLCQKDPP